MPRSWTLCFDKRWEFYYALDTMTKKTCVFVVSTISGDMWSMKKFRPSYTDSWCNIPEADELARTSMCECIGAPVCRSMYTVTTEDSFSPSFLLWRGTTKARVLFSFNTDDKIHGTTVFSLEIIFPIWLFENGVPSNVSSAKCSITPT